MRMTRNAMKMNTVGTGNDEESSTEFRFGTLGEKLWSTVDLNFQDPQSSGISKGFERRVGKICKAYFSSPSQWPCIEW